MKAGEGFILGIAITALLVILIQGYFPEQTVTYKEGFTAGQIDCQKDLLTIHSINLSSNEKILSQNDITTWAVWNNDIKYTGLKCAEGFYLEAINDTFKCTLEPKNKKA